ncbi:MnhB domain-containing protein [Halalkalicoccus tibetensis]|uniref:MnhB domain-containing protein n=1 Tax=Halalkalicoccus tibetensis TaxID=175632 RepID=A0ABD5V702_9EURY
MSAPDTGGDSYTESQVIMSTVKIVTPFVLTYGLFVTFHGADTPGGGFQGGAIIGVVILMLAFAFGIEPTRDWLANSTVIGLIAGGVVAFAGIGVATMLLGGAFLEYRLLPIPDPVRYGMEGIEILGVAAIVSGTVIGLFFVTAAGFTAETTARPERSRVGTSEGDQPRIRGDTDTEGDD